MIADMAVEIEALRSLIYRTAWLIDTGQPHILEASACKLFGSEVAHRCIDRAMQIHGAVGLSQDTPLAHLWAYARTLRLADGPDQVHMMQLGRNLARRQEAAA